MCRILIIGNGSSLWTINFFKRCIVSGFEEAVLYEVSDSEPANYYNENNIRVIINPKNGKPIYKIRKIGPTLKIIKDFYISYKISRQEHFDVINIQSITLQYAIMARIIKGKNNSRIVWSYWGSDILRCNKLIIRIIGLLLNTADFVTFDSKGLKDVFDLSYPKSKVRRKVQLLGVPAFDIIGTEIDDKRRNSAKKKFELPTDKLVIGVGYNGIQQQQHISVLESIAKVSPQFKEKIFILFQMTYGADDSYRKSVINKSNQLGIRYKVITEFLSDEDVADLRIATDIYINAQTTDAFSGSVCEHFYCNNVIFNAKWLNYEEIHLYNLKCIEFDDFSDLTIKLNQYFEGKLKIDTSGNRKNIERVRGYRYLAPEWQRILKGDYK